MLTSSMLKRQQLKKRTEKEGSVDELNVEEAAIKEKVVEEKVELVLENKIENVNLEGNKNGTVGDEDAFNAVLESSYPDLLSDQVTLETLSQELSQEFAIVTLSCPAGTKALLHCDRLWVIDHPMRIKEGAVFGWE